MVHATAVAFVVSFGVLAHGAALAADGDPIVAVTGGQIRGVLLDRGGVVFKGIPYARPPVADLRWREPLPPATWEGVRDATAFGAPCPQIDNESGFAARASTIASEDCLVLNVWTPTWPPERQRLPVMVWIHGGGNFAGAGASDVYGDGTGNTYDGESLARHGVVVVTLNYRLGTLGFFAHPELTAESTNKASGNYGLLDQVAALHWIRANAASFGGDAGRVTLFGESAGATDIGALMTSPLAEGLFHGAIAESGTVSGEPRTLAEAELDGVGLAAALGVAGDGSLRRLRELGVDALLSAPVPLFPARGRGSLRHLVVDGYAIPRSPREVFAAGEQHAVALLIGSNTRDFSPSLRALPDDLAPVLQRSYGPLAAQAMALYGRASPDPLYGTPIEQWAGDSGFRCDSVLQALWHTQAGHTAYQYEFGRVAPGREDVGAVHTAEMWYVFGSLARGTSPPGPKARYDAVDDAVSEAMQRYWTNFAKRGDPNDARLVRWPPFESTERSYMRFDDREPTAAAGLRRPFCDLYIENLRR